MCAYTPANVLEGGFSHGGVVLRGLWGLCINIQTSTQTHPAARSHHVVEKRGQSVRPLKRLTQPRQRAQTKWTLTLVFAIFSSKLRWQMLSFTFSSGHCLSLWFRFARKKEITERGWKTSYLQMQMCVKAHSRIKSSTKYWTMQQEDDHR